MSDKAQSLLALFEQLSEQDANSLLRFAEFLAAQQTDAKPTDQVEQPSAIPEPEKIPRPDKERVVDALKRLSATYPMLETKNLLNKASELVAQHVMFGKPAKEVIDQIEVLFEQAYSAFLSEMRRS